MLVILWKVSGEKKKINVNGSNHVSFIINPFITYTYIHCSEIKKGILFTHLKLKYTLVFANFLTDSVFNT